MAIEGTLWEIHDKTNKKVAKVIDSMLIVAPNPEKCKVFYEFGIPLYDTKINAILRNIHTFNSDIPSDCDVFIIPSWKNLEQKILVIARFEANALVSMSIESIFHFRRATTTPMNQVTHNIIWEDVEGGDQYAYVVYQSIKFDPSSRSFLRLNSMLDDVEVAIWAVSFADAYSR